MRLDNYLLLFEELNNPNFKKSICLYGVSDIVSRLYYDLKIVYKRHLTKIIKERLSIPYTTLYCWLKGTNPIPISKAYLFLLFWKNECLKSDLEFSKIWDDFYYLNEGYSQNSQIKVVLPREIGSNLSYLIGFFQGDGHMKKKSTKSFQEHSLYFYEADKKMLEKINDLLYELFNVKGNIYYQSNSTGSWYSLRLSSKPVYLFFEKVLGLKSGKKVREVNTPDIIKKVQFDTQLSFIRGFFDAEGGVGETYKNPWLEIGQASKDFPSEILVWIQNKLCELNIFLTKPQKSANQDYFRLRTSNRDTINKFFKAISSYHPKKLNRFETIINK